MKSNVFHNWAANEAGPRGGGTKSTNVFFDPATRIIYSYGYHFPMGRILTLPNGREAALITRRSFSKTTASHISSARFAVSHLSTFSVQDVDEPNYEEAFRQYVEDAADFFLRARRSRIHGVMLANDGLKCLVQAQLLSDTFDLGLTAPKAKDGDVASLIEKKWQAHQANLKRERELAAARRRDNAASFLAWKQGIEGARCPSTYRVDENGSAYLRIVGDQVQTSQGAVVPLADALRLYNFVCIYKAKGEAWFPNIDKEVPKVGAFSLRQILGNGDVNIGCHFISWNRISEWYESVFA